jgi:hypothetical protein
MIASRLVLSHSSIFPPASSRPVFVPKGKNSSRYFKIAVIPLPFFLEIA